jgi:predicted molibdopterin-dependent oxidoreductase YjgC
VGPAQVEAALATAEMVVFQGTNANRTSAAAHLVLPSAAYVEREGTFTNFEGRVQRFRTALDALGEARPDWEVFSGLAVVLGLPDPALTSSRADQVFQGLAGGGARVRRHELPRPRRWRTGGRS